MISSRVRLSATSGSSTACTRRGQLGVGHRAVAAHEDGVDEAGAADELVGGGLVEQRPRAVARRGHVVVGDDADDRELTRPAVGVELDALADAEPGVAGRLPLQRHLRPFGGRPPAVDHLPHRQLAVVDRPALGRPGRPFHRVAVAVDDHHVVLDERLGVGHARHRADLLRRCPRRGGRGTRSRTPARPCSTTARRRRRFSYRSAYRASNVRSTVSRKMNVPERNAVLATMASAVSTIRPHRASTLRSAILSIATRFRFALDDRVERSYGASWPLRPPPPRIAADDAVVVPLGVARDRAIDALQDRIAATCGALNRLHGELVDEIAEALRLDLWRQAGIASPEHWVKWRTGVSHAHACELVRLARRVDELPVCADGAA